MLMMFKNCFVCRIFILLGYCVSDHYNLGWPFEVRATS